MLDTFNSNDRSLILIVDDEPEIRQVLMTFLRRRACHVIETANGGQALELIPSLPDLRVVITDLCMPGPNGLSLTRTLRRDWPEIGVIVITAYDAMPAADHLRAMGVPVLGKPFAVADLLTRIREFLPGLSLTPLPATQSTNASTLLPLAP